MTVGFFISPLEAGIEIEKAKDQVKGRQGTGQGGFVSGYTAPSSHFTSTLRGLSSYHHRASAEGAGFKGLPSVCLYTYY